MFMNLQCTFVDTDICCSGGPLVLGKIIAPMIAQLSDV